MDIRRKLYFYFYFIVIQEVNHRVGRNQIDVVDIGGGLKVRMKEWRIQVKCCTIAYSFVLSYPEFNEGLTNRKILIFLGIPTSESIIVSLVYTGIAQKGNWGSNPVQARIFSGFLFATAKVAFITAMIFFSFITNTDAFSGEHRGWYCSSFFWGICARPKSKSRNPLN